MCMPSSVTVSRTIFSTGIHHEPILEFEALSEPKSNRDPKSNR
jgi:hypothetical protein